MSLKVGDKVIVIAGKDKGKEGKLLAKKGDKVLVEGINMIKKHIKPNGQDQIGGIVDKEALIHVSNVKLASKTTSDKKKKDKDEKKVRVSSKSKSKKD